MTGARPTIWIDGDAAPRACKDVIFKASQRTGLKVILVANKWQQVPKLRTIQFQLVGGGFDVADDYIADEYQPGDLVITADIPLAARVIEKGGTALRFRGEELTLENIRQRKATRDILDELRAGGLQTGGPPPFGPKEKARFAGSLDRWLAKQR